ncbi:hypothetical protein ANN_02512 [Periplaneta americana]|uniref:Uncharacterized protein n=1 Tax=Periplaneta americana TaxID=6978 RepID=A0ABQ8TWL0_PERAM|nr:hypothetical protein ANN_02512 [Periplaneta americana]
MDFGEVAYGAAVVKCPQVERVRGQQQIIKKEPIMTLGGATLSQPKWQQMPLTGQSTQGHEVRVLSVTQEKTSGKNVTFLTIAVDYYKHRSDKHPSSQVITRAGNMSEYPYIDEQTFLHYLQYLRASKGIEVFSEVRRNFHSHSWWDCRNFFTNRRLQFVQCMWLLTPSSGPKERSYRNLDNLSAIACLRADG